MESRDLYSIKHDHILLIMIYGNAFLIRGYITIYTLPTQNEEK